MRARLARFIRRSPILAGLVVIGVVALGLWLGGLPEPARWVAGIAAAAVALRQVVQLIREFRQGRWGLDVLAIAAIAATLSLRDAAAAYVVAVMITGGEAIEDAAASRAQRTLTALLDRAPRLAHRVDAQGTRDVAVTDVAVGDELLVRVGEPVPADGRLLDATADVDQSSLTGESLPVGVNAGDLLPSGSVVLGHAIRVRAAAAPADSQYQRIVAMVADAVGTKGRFVRLADRVAVPFTLVAFAVAALAWWVSGDPVRFAQVLVVATPCPLLVAAPTALVAGMDRAARMGIVVKGGDALERMASARVAAFDKTGTLTVGEPRLARVEVTPGAGYDAATLLGIAAAAEAHSVHVLAAAILAGALERDCPVVALEHVREDVGQGMRAEWQGRPVRVGRLAHVADAAHPHEPEPLAPGELAVYVAISGHVAGRLVLRDEVRPGAAEALAELRELGFERVVMLTGDGAANAAWAAAETGVTEVHSDLRPGGKVAVLESAGRTIMVGDGVNDAPVLAAADVGIAMANRGASAASETADVVLLVGDLALVPQAVRLSRRTMRIARQSVVVGVGLSVVLMLIAATGVIPALAGALAQEAVDVLTILNGLRAAGVRRRRDAPRAPARSR